MDVEVFGWLLTPAGQELLALAAEAYAAGDSALVAGARLRRTSAPEHVAAAMAQAGLRRKAAQKFGPRAARMYFTADGLEQATRVEVAAHRAARVASATEGPVLDLGCGVGADLVALADAGLVASGVDLDPLRVEVARANLDALGLPGTVNVADGTTLDLAGFGVVFADPARRGARGRTFDPDAYRPPWSFVEHLLARTAAVKVAPGIPHDRIPVGCEAEWVSWEGEVKEAVLWSPDLAGSRRRATVLTRDGAATLTGVPEPAPVGGLGAFLYEPDGTVIRAGLVNEVAVEVRGRLLDEHIAYVTGDEQRSTPFARGYEVLEELPYHEKALRAALRARDIGTLTIKKRGVDVVPEQLRKRLGLRGSQPATLVLTRARDRGKALLVRPF